MLPIPLLHFVYVQWQLLLKREKKVLHPASAIQKKCGHLMCLYYACVSRLYCKCCSVFHGMNMYSVHLICPCVSEVAVIRGWHCSAPLRPVYPVIFPSSARALNREGGSVTSLLRTTMREGGTRFTQTLSVRKGVAEVIRSLKAP